MLLEPGNFNKRLDPADDLAAFIAQHIDFFGQHDFAPVFMPEGAGQADFRNGEAFGKQTAALSAGFTIQKRAVLTDRLGSGKTCDSLSFGIPVDDFTVAINQEQTGRYGLEKFFERIFCEQPVYSRVHDTPVVETL